MLLAAARRLAVIFVGIAAGTTLVSLSIGLLAGDRPLRAVSVGFYAVGAALLVGCFVQGGRGPLRPEWGEGGLRGAGFLPRGVRRATQDERSASVRASLLLFGLGFGLIVLGVVTDPVHKTF